MQELSAPLESAGKRAYAGVAAAGAGAGVHCWAWTRRAGVREAITHASQVMDRESGLQCAELYGHYTPEELAAQAAELGREYNGALVVVERNNHGHAVMAMLEQVERYEPLFPEATRNAGWLTTMLKRPTMLERFGAMLVADPELFQSRRLLEECRTFVRHEDGGCGGGGSARRRDHGDGHGAGGAGSGDKSGGRA